MKLKQRTECAAPLDFINNKYSTHVECLLTLDPHTNVSEYNVTESFMWGR
ncbi:hypothetical protein GCM10010911_11340 [Paenibacillus nasutitermitis]|uniref:Uncharacterized protein n=1 Tax=Paenibacillus nasutitermitis TaxID=1652958 RepID=A0A916YR28_9BACL|nr:hypothetical protein GCM10010911_11340 [Paenibacillus nasutitermitis]